MSSLYIDEVYSESTATVTIPNEPEVMTTARPYALTRAIGRYGYRSYAVTDALNKAYADFKSGSGGGTGSRKVYSCSTCPGTCTGRGWKYVSCVNNGTHCRCDTGPTQKCNLSGAICKANDPKATSCSVRTYTNGSCVCDCLHGTVRATPPAAPGTVKSVSKPVTSTPLRPGVIPKPGAPGSPEAERTGRTGATATVVPPNTKFGSMDVAALQKSPAATHSALVAQQAVLRDLNGLQAAQTYAASELGMALAAVDAAEKGSRQDLVAARQRLTDARWKWNQAFYATAYAKNPKGFLAMVKGNPIQEPEVKGTVIETVKVGGIQATREALGKTLKDVQVGGLPKGVVSTTVAGPGVSTVSKVVTGISTGHWAAPQDFFNDWASSAKDISNALSPSKVQGATVSVVPGLWQLIVQAGDEMANKLSPAQEY